MPTSISILGLRNLTLPTAILLLATSLFADDRPGYTDTPYLPGSKWRVHDRDRPQPPLVTPGREPGQPPADAIVLFDGRNLDQWTGGKPGGIEDGEINIMKTGELRSKRDFGDCQLHVEWATPAKADGDPMTWGNSGILFFGKYELQIIESHDVHIYADGIAGAIYGQTPPLVNVARKPGEWQTYDIVFTAPRFEGKKLVHPAYFTAFWNGVLVQYHKASLGPTKHRAVATYDAPESTGPLALQYHHSAVRFRNIWKSRFAMGLKIATHHRAAGLQRVPYVLPLAMVLFLLPPTTSTWCPAAAADRPLLWIDACEGEPAEHATVVADLARARVVYLGERHTLERHHASQAKLIADLAHGGASLVVALEPLETSQQAGIDRFNRGDIDFDGLAAATGWAKRWTNYRQYRPVLEAARKAKAPLIGLSPSPEIIRAVVRSGGVDRLDAKLRKQLPAEMDLKDPVYEKLLAAQLMVHMAASPQLLRPMIEAQIARDEAMSAALADYLRSDAGRGRKAVVVCGSGHVAYGLGTPQRVRRRLGDPNDRIVVLADCGDVRLSAEEKAE
jgi:uncharacterized iron-regulated protein